MSFTFFFKIYAHPPTVQFACFYSEPTEVRSDVGTVGKLKIKVSMYNKISFNLPDIVSGHDFLLMHQT